MSDGKVLAIPNGANGNTTVELFDPANETWTLDDSYSIARNSPQITKLAGDGVIVVGGTIDGTSVTSETEVYDYSNGLWSVTGGMNDVRGGHRIALLGDGTVLVTGGVDRPSGQPVFYSSAEIYNSDTGVWSRTGSMNRSRINFTLTTLADGRAIAVGGFLSNNGSTSAEIFDPSTGVWSNVASLNSPRQAHEAVLLSDGKVMVYGGFNGFGSPKYTSIELYDPDTDSWTVGTGLNQPRNSPAMLTLSTGELIAVGGSSDASERYDVVETYDVATGIWTTIESLGTKRSGAGIVELADGRAFVAGGYDGSEVLSSTEVYEPDTGTPTSVTLVTTHTSNSVPSLLWMILFASMLGIATALYLKRRIS